MKITFIIPLAIMLNMNSASAQNSTEADSTGLPGDNFDLSGALEMFRLAGSPEEFEKMINTENNDVNNLDLNNDGDVDYIRLIDKKDGDVHALILQVPVSASESQDVAVIELEKTEAEKAVVQIVGDEDLYGENKIVEPTQEEGERREAFSNDFNQPSGNGPKEFYSDNEPSRIVVNVWAWPFVRFVYRPAYVVYVSPWAWAHRPVWYRPWRRAAWYTFHPRPRGYYSRFTVVHTHRVMNARRVYRPVRVTSVSVRTRNQANITRYQTTRRTTTTYRNGHYKRSRTIQHNRSSARKRRR